MNIIDQLNIKSDELAMLLTINRHSADQIHNEAIEKLEGEIDAMYEEIKVINEFEHKSIYSS